MQSMHVGKGLITYVVLEYCNSFQQDNCRIEYFTTVILRNTQQTKYTNLIQYYQKLALRRKAKIKLVHTQIKIFSEYAVKYTLDTNKPYPSPDKLFEVSSESCVEYIVQFGVEWEAPSTYTDIFTWCISHINDCNWTISWQIW